MVSHLVEASEPSCPWWDSHDWCTKIVLLKTGIASTLHKLVVILDAADRFGSDFRRC